MSDDGDFDFDGILDCFSFIFELLGELITLQAPWWLYVLIFTLVGIVAVTLS